MVSLFQNDFHRYAVQKAERLAAAVHVVTNFLDKDEPLRREMRRAALDVVRLAAELTAMGAQDTLSARTAEVASLLDVASRSQLVSAMNAKLITEEYVSLTAFVRDRYVSMKDKLISVSDIERPMSFTSVKDKVEYRTKYRTSTSDTTRRGEIMNLLNVKDKISVKDAAQSMPGVSEKTIQRELVSMVTDGVLVREGERRWATYRLPEKSSLQGTT